MTKYAKLIDGRLEWAPATIRQDGYVLANPRAERLTEMGYKPVIEEQPAQPCSPAACRPVYDEQEACILVRWEPYTPASSSLPAYELRVETLIRRRYTVSDELAILRQRDTKPEEFQDYFLYCEQCKDEAKKQ